jgi:death-on-curing protein
VIAIREELLALYGGAGDGLSAVQLEALLARPRERHADARPGLFRLAAAHAFGIARDRPLPDGNDRLALTLAGVFLELNGWRLTASAAEAASVTLALAAGELDEGGYAMWLEESCVRTRAAAAAGA